MMQNKMMKFLSLAALLSTSVSAFDYAIKDSPTIGLVDVKTSIDGIKTLFVDNEFDVSVSSVKWKAIENSTNKETTLSWETLVNGVQQDNGTHDLSGSGYLLPDKLSVGRIKVTEGEFNSLTKSACSLLFCFARNRE